MSDSSFSRTSDDEQRLYGSDRQRRALWPWIALLLGVGLLVVWRLSAPAVLDEPDDEGTRHPAVGSQLTGLSLEPLVGDAEAVASDELTGNVILINFWGPWCGPCVNEFPHLVELEQHFRRHEDFRFISVSSNQDPRDEKNLKEWTSEFVKHHGAEFPVYRDPEGRAQQLVAKVAGMPYFSFPTTLVLDRQGTIQAVWVGYRAGLERQIREVVSSILADPPAL